jgi:small subunit ribosomal protein S6
MNAYELMYIINPALDEEGTNAVIEKFRGLIETNGGEIVKLDKWGKRKLAYEINDFKEGYYILCHFKAGADVPKELDRVLKITEDVVKHMILRIEE